MENGRMQLQYAATPNYTGSKFFLSRSDQYGLHLEAAAGYVRLRGDDDFLYISKGSTNVITINASNNVGINTSSPAQQLHVYNTNNYVGALINGSNAPELCFAKGTSTTSEWKVGISGNNGDNFSISKGTINDDKLVINSGGNVLIATTTDNGRTLNVNGSGWFGGILSTKKVEMGSVQSVAINSGSTFTLLSSDKINIRTNILVSVSIYWDNNSNAQRQYLLFLGATTTDWGTPSSAITVIASNDWSSGYVGAATFTIGGSGTSRTLNISVSGAATYNVTAYARVLEM